MDITIIVDGGSYGNGSKNSVGYGSFIAFPADQEMYPVTKKQHKLEFGLGVTNNEAEYRSLISSLEFVSDAMTGAGSDLKTVSISIITDSALVIGHLSQDWKLNAPNLVPLVVSASSLCAQFKNVSFEKVTDVKMKSLLGH